MEKDSRCAAPKITRRRFLKTSAALAGAGAGSMLLGSDGLSALAFADEAAPQDGERVFNCVHHPNCYGYCQMNVHVRDGKIVKVSRGEMPDPAYNRICHRGLSHLQNIYDSTNRLKYPLRRASWRPGGGDENTQPRLRGHDSFERISWDEAIDCIASTYKRIQETYGDQAVGYQFGGGVLNVAGSTAGGRVFNLLHATSAFFSTDQAWVPGMNRVFGAPSDTYWAFNEPKDHLNAKTIISWSNNVTEAQVQDFHFIMEAKANGTKLVVVDPNFTTIASKADLWIPIRPGSDPCLYLSLIQVILDEGLQDDEILRNHTVAPFLVRDDDGMFLRMSHLGAASKEEPLEDQGGSTAVDQYVVWDNAKGAACALDEAEDPALYGAFTVDGVSTRTALMLLKATVDEYPPEVAEDITEVPADTIRELARICADGPVTHRLGYGSEQYDNGAHVGHGLATLCAMTGNVGYPGAGAGTSVNICFLVNFMASYPTGTDFTSASMSDFTLCDMMEGDHKYNGVDWPIKSMHYMGINPVSQSILSKRLIENVFPQLDIVVTQDIYFTDTCKYSDIVLPVCDWFESECIINAVGSAPHELPYSEKAMEPLFESKSDAEIWGLLGTALGFGEYMLSESEILKLYVETDYTKMFGITYETLKERHRIRYSAQETYIPWRDYKFNTPSGRMEFYCETPVNRVESRPFDVERERLPHWFPPMEAWPENELYSKYPLVLMSLRHRSMAHSMFFGNKWLREVNPEPEVHLNPKDAEARGLENHSYVELYNDRGSCAGKLIYDEGMRPGMIGMFKNFQSWQHIDGSHFNSLLNSQVDPVAVNSSFYDTLVEVRAYEGEDTRGAEQWPHNV